MKKEFPGYFSSDSNDVNDFWADSLLVLDSNVLLNLYRYSDLTRLEFVQVINALVGRVWIPNQVAKTYLANRVFVIGEQLRRYDEAIKNIDSLRRDLESQNRHPFVSPKTLSSVSAIFELLCSELRDNKDVHEKRIVLDEIKDDLEYLLDGRVGPAYSIEELTKIFVSGKERYAQKCPPGYSDAAKGGGASTFNNECKVYSDYVTWLQMIDKSKSSGRSIVFITADLKDDWWQSFQGKAIGPRTELIDEFLQATGRSFYLCSPGRFLERANNYLQQEISEEAVEEIRATRTESSTITYDDVTKEWSATSSDGGVAWSPSKLSDSTRFGYQEILLARKSSK